MKKKKYGRQKIEEGMKERRKKRKDECINEVKYRNEGKIERNKKERNPERKKARKKERKEEK